jgi:hypothetical protein
MLRVFSDESTEESRVLDGQRGHYHVHLLRRALTSSVRDSKVTSFSENSFLSFFEANDYYHCFNSSTKYRSLTADANGLECLLVQPAECANWLQIRIRTTILRQ